MSPIDTFLYQDIQGSIQKDRDRRAREAGLELNEPTIIMAGGNPQVVTKAEALRYEGAGAAVIINPQKGLKETDKVELITRDIKTLGVDGTVDKLLRLAQKNLQTAASLKPLESVAISLGSTLAAELSKPDGLGELSEKLTPGQIEKINRGEF